MNHCGHHAHATQHAADRCELERLREDRKLLDWLNEQVVDAIRMDDFSVIDVRGLDVRTAIRNAITASADNPQA